MNTSAEVSSPKGGKLCAGCGLVEVGDGLLERFELDLSWLSERERSTVTRDLAVHHRLIDRINGVLWVMRNSSFAEFYEIKAEGKRLIFAPKTQPLKLRLLEIAKRRRQRVVLRYGDSLRRRVTLVHKVTPWGFVGIDHLGYRNFKRERIHNLQLEDPRSRVAVAIDIITIAGGDDYCVSCSLNSIHPGEN